MAEENQAVDYGDELDPAMLEEHERENLDKTAPEDTAAQDEAPANEADEPAEDDLDADALLEVAGNGRKDSIPKPRFDEVNEKYKTERAERLRLEEELARARGGKAEPKEEPAKVESFDFDAAEDRYQDAFLAGDSALARQIRREIRSEERKEAEAAAEKRIEARYAANEQERQAGEFRELAAKVEREHPELLQGSDEFDSDLFAEVQDLTKAWIQSGKTPAQALAKAVALLIKPKAAAEAAKPAAKDKVIDIDKHLARERRIPPETEGVGERAKKVDPRKLTEEEWSKLPEDEKRVLRGDFLTK